MPVNRAKFCILHPSPTQICKHATDERSKNYSNYYFCTNPTTEQQFTGASTLVKVKAIKILQANENNYTARTVHETVLVFFNLVEYSTLLKYLHVI